MDTPVGSTIGSVAGAAVGAAVEPVRAAGPVEPMGPVGLVGVAGRRHRRDRRGRDRRIFAATLLCAAGAPISAAAWVSARTAQLAEHIGAAGGGTARIGTIDADLTGTIRLGDVAFGPPFAPPNGSPLGPIIAADTVEASVALESLFGGALRADEIRVIGPRVAVRIDRDGDSDLARLARRLMSHARGPDGAERARDPGRAGDRGEPGRLRRIVVRGGTLTAHVAGIGELTADGVELVPDAGGVRVITGAVRVAGRAGPIRGELAFARSAAELTLPRFRLGRVLAVGGTGAITALVAPGDAASDAAPNATPDATNPAASASSAALMNAFDAATAAPIVPIGVPTIVLGEPGGPGGHPAEQSLVLRDVSAGRLAVDGALSLRASAIDGGVPRAIAIDATPRDGAIAIHGERVPLGAFAALAPHGLALGDAHATGSLTARRDATHAWLDVDAVLDGVAIDHRVIAPIAVPVAAAVHASIAVSPDAIAVSQGAIDVGAAHLVVSGWLRRGAPASGQLDMSLARAACGDLLAALPAELRGPLDGMMLTGSIGGRVRLAVDLAAPAGDGVELTAAITDGCHGEAEPPAADVTRLTAVADEVFPDGSHARIGPGERGWTALRQLPRHVAGAFVSAEDARFFDHAGFDLAQIAKSLEIDLREHRLARGGSTISQQLVKNAFLSQRRSFDRKLQEAILTWRLESRLDKPQILERYLNIIELGPRVFGLAAAAKHWFDVSPRELSVREAAFLAALTSEPTSMSRRVRRAGGLDPDSAARVDVVLNAMYRDGAIDAAELAAARQAPLRFVPAVLTQDR